MSNITIFEEPSSVPTVQRESRRMDRMSSGGGGSTMRRIQLSNGRTFKRVINGEQIGKAATDTLDVIIVDWLVEPSRKFYAAAYDKDAKATLPDCWSNDGVAPEAGASNKQSKACASCPKNVKGSGTGGKGKACRYERRLAVLVAGDPSGDIYQIAIPGASLFSDNDGNVYGFEGYKKFMLASKHALDTVVTRLIYDTEADTAKVGFKPIRHLTEMEASLVDAAQDDPATEKYTMLTVGAVDSAKAIAAPAPVVAIAAPTASVNPFGDDEDEDEAPATPVKRAAKPKVTPEVKPELASVMGEWLKEEEEEEDDFA
jgi:hypothetical protein